VSAKAEGLRAEDITSKYSQQFIEDLKILGIDTNDIQFPRASEYVQEQIKMVQELEKKGYTYRTHDGIYFDTSKFADYGTLGGISDAELKTGDKTTLEDRITIAAGRRLLTSHFGNSHPSPENASKSGHRLGESVFLAGISSALQ
jgi:cysteinyl-tRNA synthetase